MTTITLDTSCLDLSYPELKALEDLQNKGKIELWIELSTEIEKENWEDVGKKIGILRWMACNTKQEIDVFEIPPGKTIDDVVPWSIDEEWKIYKKIMSIHSPEFKNLKNLRQLKGEKIVNKHIDCHILALHILRKRDFFATKDIAGFIGKKGEKKKQLESCFGIKIRYLDNDFIQELKK